MTVKPSASRPALSMQPSASRPALPAIQSSAGAPAAARPDLARGAPSATGVKGPAGASTAVRMDLTRPAPAPGQAELRRLGSQYQPGAANPFQRPAQQASGPPPQANPKGQLLARLSELKSVLPGGPAGPRLPAEKLFESRAFQALSPQVQNAATELMTANLTRDPKAQDRVLQIVSNLDGIRSDGDRATMLSALKAASPLSGAQHRDDSFFASIRLLQSPEFQALPADKQQAVVARVERSRADAYTILDLRDQVRSPNF